MPTVYLADALPPFYRADGAKVAVKQRALGGHVLYGYSASKNNSPQGKKEW